MHDQATTVQRASQLKLHLFQRPANKWEGVFQAQYHLQCMNMQSCVGVFSDITPLKAPKLCLSLQWRRTRARPTPVSTEGAVCRKVTAIAATVLRASLEKAARLVSHCQVSIVQGNLGGWQLQAAPSLYHKAAQRERLQLGGIERV